ncbi:MAG: type II secretion system major pseudopilin GspG [Acidobacteria bacterium]|nr:type II secretion system major pseudopilin GspG [Acidobacteriota bacterium]MBI3658148.1 type II secretion system major pseudopilin GspG [Acidobacteriota bacterium]
MKRRRERQARDRGFTLVELIVVVTILALLMGLVAPRMLKQGKNAKIKIAKMQIEKIKTQLERASLDVGRYPANEEEFTALTQNNTGAENWNGPYLDKGDLLDPWQKRIQYRFPCQHGGRHDYDLFSTGPNQVEDPGEGGDDVRSWE